MPAVGGLERGTGEFVENEEVIVDGEEGVLILRPTPETVREYTEKKKAYTLRIRDLAKFARLPAVTRDGKTLKLLANIEFPEEADVALRSGADGVGVYRTEILYLNRRALHSEEEQFRTYSLVPDKVARHHL